MSIPLGILASAHKSGGPVVPLRTKVVTGASIGGSGATVTFDEATALDSTHLLVVLVSSSSNAVPTISGFTTLVSGGSTARRSAVYARQGNGSVNSATIVAGGGVATITLLAFAGYSSLTPLATGNGAPTSASYPVELSSAPSNVRGVVAAALVSGGSSGAVGAWSNSYTELVETTTGPRASQAWRPNDGTTALSTVTVSSNTAGGWAVAALPLL